MHVAVLTTILMSVLIGLGFGRSRSFYLTVSIIALFIVMTGLQASAIRAGIMGGFYLLGGYLGRQNSSARTIVFAGAGMLAANPLLLRLDIGFQLSFLAMLGIIYLMPTLKRWLKNEILAMTLSAYLFTLPVLIYNFGYFSSVAIFTNFLIVPLLPYIMGIGFIFGIAGMIFQPLGWILSWPSWLLLTYLIKIVEWFSQVPSVII
jgi:competence protein ComEC